MKLCFPVESNEGLESTIYGHFGSAPMFVVVDTETLEIKGIANRDLHHAHGSCSPLKALGDETVDGIVIVGIGTGAMMGLIRAGLKVYQADGVTIADNLASLRVATLPELAPGHSCCGGHGHGQGCGH